MESLAFLASLILLTILMAGPIALGLSFKSNNKIVKFLALVIAIFSIISGFWFLSLQIGLGARLVGLFAIASGLLSIYRIFKK